MPQTLSSSVLRSQCARILEAAGSTPAEAAQVADNLVLANLSGHDSHGVGMLPRYVDAVAEGGLVPNAAVKINTDIGTLLALDGQHGYGQIVGVQAMELGIARAKQHGSCIFTLANAHHLGRIGHFAEMATAEGLVSMHFVNVLSRPVVAPWGGGDGRFGTNPCCIGIPLAGAEPFLLDFATSRVAQGKMRVAHNKGERVPDGYLIDERGAPTNDPGVVVVPQANGLFGALMTFGEHKGYGMAMACELLGGALTGGGTWHYDESSKQRVMNGMLVIVIDAKRLGTAPAFEREARLFLDWLRKSRPAPGFDKVRIAGEPEREMRDKRTRDGIPVDDITWEEIQRAADKVKLPRERLQKLATA
ncbi:MAG: malate/lactate/ureidoglycolate dehydrogenase [Caulobacter sp.]|nr:malate/lactate/ureidoglycolate dehydrogenase [Caulobacter sp.]